MYNFKEFLILEAGGQAEGEMELKKITVEEAREYAEKIFNKNGLNLDEEIPDFDENFRFAQQIAMGGWTKRKEMPVINSGDVKKFQKKIEQGHFDIEEPFADVTDKNEPFPRGLTDKEAQVWLNAGLKDGDKKDDRKRVSLDKVEARKLRPIQEQMYFDKVINNIVKAGGVEKSLKKLSEKIIIASNDNRILDGHHRFITILLANPSMKQKVLKIDLPIDELLKLSNAYTDAIGNERNK